MYASTHSYSFITSASSASRTYLTNGPAVRVHENKGKRPKHHLTLQQIKDVIQYILNYTGLKQYIAEYTVHYIVHVRAQQRQMQWSDLDEFLDTRALISSFSPSSTTKHKVWELYQEAAGVQSMHPVGYSSFTGLWRQLLPHVMMKPMSDLCWLCQCNSAAITRSANRPEEKTMVC